MDTDPTHGLSDDELADLARLADGTLPDDRRAEVEARVAASPQLASIVKSQGSALRALQSTADVGAPMRLRENVARSRDARARGPKRTPVLARGAVAVALAGLLALVLVLSGPFSSDPSVPDVAALGEKPPTQAGPAAASGTPSLLDADVEEVPFPNYAVKFGWKPAGAREDDPSGREATTVYYEKGGRTIAYTIVSGDGLDPPSDARTTKRGGVEYRAFRSGSRDVVTWERDGHTCVLSGKDTPSAELVTLADWRGKGAIPF